MEKKVLWYNGTCTIKWYNLWYNVKWEKQSYKTVCAEWAHFGKEDVILSI